MAPNDPLAPLEWEDSQTAVLVDFASERRYLRAVSKPWRDNMTIGQLFPARLGTNLGTGRDRSAKLLGARENREKPSSYPGASGITLFAHSRSIKPILAAFAELSTFPHP